MQESLKDILKQLPQTNYGMALKAYLLQEMDLFDTVDGIKTFEEARGRQLAKEMIKKIFAFYPQGALDKKSKPNYS